MKKLMIPVFILALLFVCGSVMADPSEEQILFRGIPWQASVTEALQEFNDWKRYGNGGPSYEYQINGLRDAERSREIGFARIVQQSGVKVAGYPVRNIVLQFVYSVDEHGLLDRSEENAKFCIANYEIFQEETDVVMDDLKFKLSHKYGDIDETPTDSCSVWWGAEGTVVSLWPAHSWGVNSYRPIYINYSSSGCRQLLVEAKNALDYEFSIDTEGL